MKYTDDIANRCYDLVEALIKKPVKQFNEYLDTGEGMTPREFANFILQSKWLKYLDKPREEILRYHIKKNKLTKKHFKN